RWEFDMENDNMKGHWIGVFTQKDGQTEIDFTEDVIAKKVFMKPFVKSYLKKQQSQYISDLKKELSL
ncbi:MAG: polyketide cyclase, partial [Lachnospiraceae bacterium]|nr:polyketide cyclase [Lachnospiraceae bacterium]